ncbi:MAG: sulfotransferase family 2 domain-containing protein [Planctomycetota bacterium]
MFKRLFQKSDATGKPPLHFLHIGKTGGTAIRHALKDDEATGQFQLVMHSHPTTLSDIPRGEGVVFFLRDPVSRFVSGFWSRFRKGRPRYHVPWNKMEEQAFSRFQTPLELAEALGSEASDERTAAEAAMNGINHVRFRYSAWLGSVEQLEMRLEDVFFVGFQESLATDFRLLIPRLGVSDSLTLPGDGNAAHKTPAHLKQALSETAAANLRRWYSDDYELLEYCKTVAAGINSEPGSDDGRANG